MASDLLVSAQVSFGHRPIGIAIGFAWYREDFGYVHQQYYHEDTRRVGIPTDRFILDVLLAVFSVERQSIGNRNALQIFACDCPANDNHD